MTWAGLRHKGVEILFPEEWNTVVDALDILYAYTAESVKKEELLHLDSDIIPDQDNIRNLGDPSKSWKEIHAHYGYFDDNVYVQGKQVLKDGDPVQVYRFIEEAKTDIDNIYRYVKQPVDLQTQRLIVGTSPVPLSDVDMTVKRIHIKVPSWALYLIYIGNSSSQEFILEPRDKETLELENPRKVYVRSLGNVEIFVAFEV